MTNPFTALRQVLRAKLQSGLMHLPRKAKRLIFVASLLPLLDSSTAKDEVLISKLNSILRIARDDKAWGVPISFSSLIWSDIGSDVIHLSFGTVGIHNLQPAKLTSDDQVHFADLLISKMPSWLSYGSVELIRHDVAALITQLTKVAKA